MKNQKFQKKRVNFLFAPNHLLDPYRGDFDRNWHWKWPLFFAPQIRLETESRGIFSRRGILAEFWALGCATPVDPGNGYLHIRNHTHATYACHTGHVFQDSLERTKTLVCDEEISQWRESIIVNCVSLQYLRYYFWLISIFDASQFLRCFVLEYYLVFSFFDACQLYILSTNLMEFWVFGNSVEFLWKFLDFLWYLKVILALF